MLKEKDIPTGQETTFTVTPEGSGSRVRITTEWEKGGIAGLMDRLLSPPYIRKLFRDEIGLLEKYARSQKAERTPQTV